MKSMRDLYQTKKQRLGRTRNALGAILRLSQSKLITPDTYELYLSEIQQAAFGALEDTEKEKKEIDG